MHESTRCLVSTQASTKVYRNPLGRPCGHRLNAVLEAGSFFALVPDPVQPFAESLYTQRQEVRMHPTAGLVLVDWVSSGRAARGERWAFKRIQSRNEVWRGADRLLLDSLSLEPESAPPGHARQLGRFNCLALVLVPGDRLRAAAARLLKDVSAQPVARRAPLVGRESLRLAVTNLGDRPVQVGSHYHFIETNAQLQFDRAKAYGKRLDIPSGTAVRFEPGETKTVPLVEIAGARVIRGGNHLGDGPVSEAGRQAALERVRAQGFADAK